MLSHYMSCAGKGFALVMQLLDDYSRCLLNSSLLLLVPPKAPVQTIKHPDVERLGL